MSSTNDATVPPHLINSGITEEADVASASRGAGRRRVLPLALGGVALFVLGLLIGQVMARRSDNPVLAIVNGVPIDQRSYNHRCETVIANNAAIGQQVMRQMVQDELALQYAAKLGVTPSDTDINQKFTEAAKAPGFADNLKKSLQTQEDLKRALKVNLSQTNALERGITVTEAEIKNYYNQNIDQRNPQARYYTPDAVQIAAVISDKEADINNALHDLASGVSFAQVAQKYSKDKSATNAGVLPPIRHGSLSKVPGLENQLFQLNPGQQIDHIKVGNTFWLVRCIGRSHEATKPFDEVKDDCRQNTLLTKAIQTNGQAVKTDYQSFTKSADIKAVQPQYTDAVNIK